MVMIVGEPLAAVVQLRAPVAGDDDLRRLRRAVDLRRLIEVGYDPDARVIVLSADNPVFGHDRCPVAGCAAAACWGGMCRACYGRFKRAGIAREAFVAIPRVFVLSGRREQRLCRVCCTPGHERPACRRSGLCLCCDQARKNAGQSVEQYAATATPRRSFGRCARCERWAEHRDPAFCTACHTQWKTHGRPDPLAFTSTPLPMAGAESPGLRVDLAVLGERLELELLFAFQQTWLDGGYKWAGAWELQALINTLAGIGVTSLLDERVAIDNTQIAALYRRLHGCVELLLADPELELERDLWRLGLLRADGGRNTIDYTAISQPWLREAAKQSNRQRVVSHSINHLRSIVAPAVELSAVLGLRGDRGEDPRALGRSDAVDFLVHLAGRERQGEISKARQRECVLRVRGLLGETRERGLHRRAGPIEGLAAGFALHEGDLPRKMTRDPEGEPERALPQVVIDQLLAPAAIALLVQVVGEAMACAIELQMRTGRRPQEIIHAPFKCLGHEQRMGEDGKVRYLPVFVYRPEKRPKTRKELPVFAEERRLIKRMQRCARERFPDGDPNVLPLLPRFMRNRDGRHALHVNTLAIKMRDWVDAVPELLGVDGEPFDRAKVFPYAFRHSYAQRLADENATEMELMDLMDHDSFSTTMGYFRIRAGRRRRAAELGRRALFDNEGRRLMAGLTELSEAERRRMQIGSLAVPYGACTEPANVASMGASCKFMLKCLGCKHFRTDLSHLPALEAYERELVAARERLLARADDVAALEDWARAAALPSQQEIDRVRHMIARIRETIGELEPDERAELQSLLDGERINRSSILERLPARYELSVLNVGATFDAAEA